MLSVVDDHEMLPDFYRRMAILTISAAWPGPMPVS